MAIFYLELGMRIRQDLEIEFRLSTNFPKMSAMTHPARLLRCLFFMLLLAPVVAMADAPGQDMEAVTVAGDQVLLHPNGRWEYVDAAKAEAAKAVAKQYPENQGCPPGWQGGHFGLGRCIPPGDKDFNRGSRIGKGP